jgi:hypothetical protein
MLYLEESFPLPAKNDVLVTSKLGSGVDSILPRADIELPPPLTLCPFLLFQYEDFVLVDNLTLIGVAHVRVFDIPGEQYWRINAIVAELVRVYRDSMNVWYEDPSGSAWKQAIATISHPDTDDGWNLRTRWIDVQLWRSPR